MPYWSVKTARDEWIVDSLEEAKSYVSQPFVKGRGYIIEHSGTKAKYGYVGGAERDRILYEFYNGRIVKENPTEVNFSPIELRRAKRADSWESFRFSFLFFAALVACALLVGVCNVIESCQEGVPPSLGGC